MNFYKKYTSKLYSFLMIDTTLVSLNHLRFKKLLQEEYKNQSWQLIIRLEIKTTYDFNREAAKISALSLGKIDKYEYLAGEEILLVNESQIIEQAKFTYSPVGTALEKQTNKKQLKIKVKSNLTWCTY